MIKKSNCYCKLLVTQFLQAIEERVWFVYPRIYLMEVDTVHNAVFIPHELGLRNVYVVWLYTEIIFIKTSEKLFKVQ